MYIAGEKLTATVQAIARSVHHSPLGFLELAASARGLVRLAFVEVAAATANYPEQASENVHLRQAAEELDAYFTGELDTFSVPLDPAGTSFQRKVWRSVAGIAFGQTRSYGQLAREIGSPRGSQAVGLANGQNPIPVIIPCHRVIGADGKLTGYSGGIERKKWLLRHEMATLF